MDTLATSTSDSLKSIGETDFATDLETSFTGLGEAITESSDSITSAWDKILAAMKLSFDTFISGIGTGIASVFGGGASSSSPPPSGGEEGAELGLLVAIKEGMLLAIQELQLAWDTFIFNVTSSWNLLWQNALLFFGESFMLLLQQGLTTFLTETWLIFTEAIRFDWATTFETMLESFQLFIDEMLVNINDLFLPLLQGILDKVGDIETAFTDMGDEAEDAFEKGEEAGEDLIEVLKKVERKLDSIIKKAQSATGALAGIFSASGVKSAQGGDFDTTAGLYQLHDKEMVLPPRIAESMRDLILNMNRIGIGRQGINVGVASGVPFNGGSSSVTNTNNNAQVNINANYIETQSPIQIRDDVLLALQLLN
jgi:hypothetical protein